MGTVLRSHVRRDGRPKVSYLSEQSAREAAARWGDVVPYRCWLCGAWHLASKPERA